jgi:Fe-S-cluster containining protein
VIDAGPFAAWLADVRAAVRGEVDADVPCGDCFACCASSQFVHIGPDEAETLAHIPAALLFDAPGFPAGHVLMGYDDQGRCPMLVEGRCSIYPHRPRTCRSYDCRVFTAAGVAPDAPGIAGRVAEWRFDYPTSADEAAHEEVRAAAAGITGTVNATDQAVRAVMAGDLSGPWAQVPAGAS